MVILLLLIFVIIPVLGAVFTTIGDFELHEARKRNEACQAELKAQIKQKAR